MVYHRSSRREESSQEGRTEPKNAFRNDGSFLEMFKKMQESSSSSSSAVTAPASSSSSSSTSTSSQNDKQEPEPDEKSQPDGNRPASALAPGRLPIVGKRRGGRVLPTGKVKKVKVEKKEVEVEQPKDAWSQYLAEVKKYKETTCEEEVKTRPLVK